ncbi:MAG TPA: hypothetical protein VIH58_10525, partial [Chthoniobacterales bacterium]
GTLNDRALEGSPDFAPSSETPGSYVGQALLRVPTPYKETGGRDLEAPENIAGRRLPGTTHGTFSPIANPISDAGGCC